MRLEEIQDKMEKVWKKRAAGIRIKGCPWCTWARGCSWCPLALTFDFSRHTYACGAFDPYWLWTIALPGTEEEKAAATVLYRLLVDNREEILRIAKEIEDAD